MGPRDEAVLPEAIFHAARDGDEAVVAAWLDGSGHVDAQDAEHQIWALGSDFQYQNADQPRSGIRVHVPQPAPERTRIQPC